MDLTLDRTALLAALRLVRRAAGRASTCPGLDAVLVAAGSDGADRASLAATDLAVGLTQSIDAAVAEPGRALLPVRLLLDLVAGLPDGPLRLQRDEAEPFGGGRGAVTIIAGEVRIDIAGRPPEDHPGVPPGAPGGTPG